MRNHRVGRAAVGALLLLLSAVGYLLMGATAGPASSRGSIELQAAPGIRASGSGPLFSTQGVVLQTELLTVDPALTSVLLSLPMEGTTLVPDWPVAAGVRHDVQLTRYNVYSPGARLIKVEGTTETDLPRSRLAFFHGRSERDAGVSMSIHINPESGLFGGFSRSSAGIYELQAAPSGTNRRLHSISPANSSRPAGLTPDQELILRCGADQIPIAPARGASRARETDAAPRTPELTATLHTLTVAVDTDNEAMLHWADNTTTATNFIASLFAAVNVAYERDLNIRLLQGTTIFRISTTPDPYTGGTSYADNFAKLEQFGTHWRNTYGGVTRGLAMLLSGKEANSYGGSGIAYTQIPETVLCNADYGYSFSMFIKAAGAMSFNAKLIGHELGHNFRSPHTHCYSPPADTCYNAEASCWAGGTSCPTASTINGVANVQGTLMSYCNFLGGCDNSLVFHPRSITEYISGAIDSKVGQCVLPAAQKTFLPFLLKN